MSFICSSLFVKWSCRIDQKGPFSYSKQSSTATFQVTGWRGKWTWEGNLGMVELHCGHPQLVEVPIDAVIAVNLRSCSGAFKRPAIDPPFSPLS